MRLAYLDCFSGISGDMTLGALIDAGVDQSAVSRAVESLGLPECRITAETVRRGAFRATHVRVRTVPEHKHRHLHHIVAMIDRAELTDPQKQLAKDIFNRLAAAEAKVHGSTIEKVHFHEVGAADSIADIVGSAVAWDLLGVDRVVASAVPTGKGTIRIEHGTVALPAPGTAELLKGVPLASSEIEAELTTPTGAAILTTVAHNFGAMPAMTVEAIGYGAGSRDMPQQPNVLRLFVGRANAAAEADEVTVLETNLDNVTGETVGYCIERLWDAGALDVYTSAIAMKKNRPGVKLSVLCNTAEVSRFEQIIFRETGSLGIRRWAAQRHKQSRRAHEVSTLYGAVAGKLAWLGGETPSFAPEFEACRRIAAERGVALREVYGAALRAFDASAVKVGE